jgi:phosphoribosyl 1,2-cyclic phosphodiesterase
MRVAVLASGSKGNSTYIETDNTKSLIDIGMSNLYIENRLKELNIEPDSIDNVFITHTHIDHIAGLKVFIKKHKPHVFLTQKMYEELKETINFESYTILEDKVYLNDLVVTYFKTSHDAPDSVGYVFESKNEDIVYVTDTGYINNKNFELLKNRSIYIFESNHDVELLMENPNYPYNTKQRILGDKGHLSNKDSSYYLSKFVGDKTKNIILAHLSEQNNDPILAKTTLEEKLNNENINIMIAKQNESTALIEV